MMVIICLFLSIPFLMCTMAFWGASFRTDAFCDDTDVIFQFIEANYANWEGELFSENSSHLRNAIRFEVDHRSYLARPALATRNVRLIFVSIAETWPPIPQGSKGYIVVYSESFPQDYWFEAYNVQKIKEYIYCYSEYEIK